MRLIVLCKSQDVEIVQDTAGVFNTEGNDNKGVAGKTGCPYSSFCDLIHILRFVG
jgi:hypothetical protein